MAIECCSTLSVSEVLCENLTAYDEIRLYRACKAIYHGNQIRREWWQHMENMIQATMSESSQTLGDTNAPLPSTLSRENVAVHEYNTNDTRSLHHMPGTTVEQQWLNYVHRETLNDYERSSYGSSFTYADESISQDEPPSEPFSSNFGSCLVWAMGSFGPRGGPPCEQCRQLPSVYHCDVLGLLCNRCLQGNMNKQLTEWWGNLFREHPVMSDTAITRTIAEYVWGDGLEAYCYCGRCNPNWFLRGWICWPTSRCTSAEGETHDA